MKRSIFLLTKDEGKGEGRGINIIRQEFVSMWGRLRGEDNSIRQWRSYFENNRTNYLITSFIFVSIHLCNCCYYCG